MNFFSGKREHFEDQSKTTQNMPTYTEQYQTECITVAQQHLCHSITTAAIEMQHVQTNTSILQKHRRNFIVLSM